MNMKLIQPLANRAATCTHSYVDAMEVHDGTFAPAYFCIHQAYSPDGTAMCLLIMICARNGKPPPCDLAKNYTGPESLRAEEMQM